MNAKNYDYLMEKEIASLAKKPSLLLHCCCAPCASACLERLFPFFDVTAFYYNPNIEAEEYLKRKNELSRLISQTGWAKELECERDEESFYAAVRGLEREKEGGKRCEECFKLRLKKTADTAERLGFDYFATTLTVSPLKNAALINEIGETCAAEKAVKWLHSDFKKRNGYKNSLQLSEKYGLYRQNYCGCVYGKNAE